MPPTFAPVSKKCDTMAESEAYPANSSALGSGPIYSMGSLRPSGRLYEARNLAKPSPPPRGWGGGTTRIAAPNSFLEVISCNWGELELISFPDIRAAFRKKSMGVRTPDCAVGDYESGENSSASVRGRQISSHSAGPIWL